MTATYDHAYRRARDRVLAGAQACAICGGLLDFDAPPRSPLSPSVDHVYPVKLMETMDAKTWRELLVSPENLRPCHLKCNSRRQDGRREKPRHVSREWR